MADHQQAQNSRAVDRGAFEGADTFGSGYVSDVPPVVIGGCARSGTTLLRVILDSHRRLCCGPESKLFFQNKVRPARLSEQFDMYPREVIRLARNAGSRAEFIEGFFEEYARRSGKTRWAEKTPRNIEHLDYIFRAFPNARFVHVIRDGRDVVCSLRTFPRHKVVDGELVRLDTWNPIGECIDRWVASIAASKPYREDPRYFEVRYEDLVLDTRSTVERLLEFLDEPWDERTLRYSEVKAGSRDVTKFPQNPEATQPVMSKSIGRWRRDLAPDEQALFKERAGELLDELGYENPRDW